MDAGVVDHHLDRPGFEQCRDRRSGRVAVGDVEDDRLGAAARGDDGLHHLTGARQVAVGVHDDVVTVCGEAAADRPADIAAAAGDQGAFSSVFHAVIL